MSKTKGEISCWGMAGLCLFLIPVFLFSGCDRTNVTDTLTDWRSQPYSTTFDNHKFIITGNGGIIHHPDCQCPKKNPTKKEKQ